VARVQPPTVAAALPTADRPADGTGDRDEPRARRDPELRIRDLAFAELGTLGWV
jgi:hypothetical protein